MPIGMLKRLIKSICYKIYTIGKFEDIQLLERRRKEALGKVALIDETAWISEHSIIDNKHGLKEKIRVGKKSRITGDLLLLGNGGEIIIGDYCFLGPDSRIWSAKKITIGDRVLISHNVNIHDNISHSLNSIERHNDFVGHIENHPHENYDLREKEIIIEDDAWIGFNATVLKGVTIGKGAIVGANTVITKDVPPYAVVIGNPAKILKYTD
jgi:acetyltransferase-like isoleucine patch superfamily enzyme